jgi:aspartyl-tRNA(Asn)/glutamyl-tRNA(Gln) amidotransferase subunit B
VVVDDDWLSRVREQMTELPAKRQRRYIDELGLSPVETAQLIDEPAVCRFFEDVLAEGVDAKRGASMLLNYGAKRANEQQCRIDQLGITAAQIKGIAELVAADKIGSSAADKLFGLCCESDEPADKLAEKHNLLQVSDTGALEGFIDQILADAKNEKAIADIKDGKDKAIGALMGQIMKLSKGQANPKLVTDLIKQKVRG